MGFQGYLRACDNNRSSTVLNAFLQAVGYHPEYELIKGARMLKFHNTC